MTPEPNGTHHADPATLSPGTPPDYCCACAHSNLYALVEQIARIVIPGYADQMDAAQKEMS